MDTNLESLIDSKSDEEIETLLTIRLNSEYNPLRKVKPRPQRVSKLKGHEWVVEVLNGHPNTCYDLFRMDKHVFRSLCEELKRTATKDSKYLSVQEQLAIFLLIISHNGRQRYAADRFQHSTDTISKYFRKILFVICSISKHIITPPSFDDTPPEIKNNPKYYPFFKKCVGAIDGTHISARIPVREQIPYRGRKFDTTQNIMSVCSFDMRFTFIMTGWEGTTNDSRIFLETVSNPANHFPMPPLGKY
ncbi:unnamed protein product [Cuscuta epithymum]|uniref:DDE Tnp4 domain-containing protein n=1 Tax=Cuscuta epithymum TaxID=186058 RepID=A0AAV0G0B6_9ASTE|nr:unnamed protein product [Cuscuta epithymum]CAH9141271.1 unnamed protein product [Cuscuta epithymum]